MKLPEGKWLAAVSSGPDSMALLHMCLVQGVDVAAVHVNYHHRPEADEEEMYVRAFCKEHGIPCFVRNEPFVYEGNFEAAAREWRYDFFVQTAQKYGYKGVLVAHHEDDLLETYFMQEEKNLIPEYYGLKEGSVYHGMRVMRPLLDYSKKQLEEYCNVHGIRYYIDSTNADETYARNRIRHQFIEPMTRFERDMVLQEIRQKNAVMRERRCRVRTMIRTDRVNLMQYRALGNEDREALLRMVAEPEKKTPGSLSLKHIREMDHILMTQDDFMIEVRGKYIVQDEGFFFLFEPVPAYEDVYEDKNALKNACREGCYDTEEGSPSVYAVSVSDEDFPVTIRTVRDGDKIEMRYGTKPVHRFFIDRHIPLYRRTFWPVVCNVNKEVILVPGLGCDVRHFTTTPYINVLEYTLRQGD